MKLDMKKLRTVSSIPRRVKNKIFGKPKFKQELLFRMALKEKGFKLRKLNIKIDHLRGFNYVNNIKLGIKFPHSFYYKAIELIPSEKKISYHFNGNMSDYGGHRKKLLDPFITFDGSRIIESEEGRVKSNKDKFNYSYFTELANAKYGLSPHHPNWPGYMDFLWTYRFIESCFVNTIPVLFKNAPLTNDFVNGFKFIWDIDILKNPKKYIEKYSFDDAEFNRKLAFDRFCLTNEECDLINNSLK
jgi:hypothetical protein